MSGLETQQRAPEGRSDERAQHAADSGEAKRSGPFHIQFEPVRHQRPKAAARVGQRCLRAKTAPCDERHEGCNHHSGCMAIIETAGAAELRHHLGKNSGVIAEDSHQYSH